MTNKSFADESGEPEFFGNQTITLKFNWDTTGVPASAYRIKANASVVPDEYETTNNELTDGTVGWPDVPRASFTYSPAEPVEGENIDFSASLSTPDGGTLTDPDSYAWDFDSDGVVDAYGKIVTHAYTIHGTYAVNLTVTDSDGLSDAFQDSVKVYALPVASFSYLPLAPIVDQLVTFDASGSSDPDGTIASYTWDFGDENVTVVTEATVTHVYASAGTYDVNLTVTDGDGLTDTYVASLTVGKRTSTITMSADPTSVSVGENVTITGSINPIRVGVTVTIEHRLSGAAAWSLLAEAQTDASSGYTYTWETETEGEYELRASWGGDSDTLGDESPVATVTVEAAAGPDITLYVAVGVVIAAAAAGVAVYFLKFRKG